MQRGFRVEFAGPDAMLAALDALRDRGYRSLETYGPAPVDGTAQRLALGRPMLPKLVFAAGAGGALAGYAIQWYANVYRYPLNVGGRPLHSAPAYVPITFESLVLAAALVAVAGLLLFTGLPALWHPAFEVDGFERASDDRYWVEIRDADDVLDAEIIARVLAPLEPLRIVPASEL